MTYIRPCQVGKDNRYQGGAKPVEVQTIEDCHDIAYQVNVNDKAIALFRVGGRFLRTNAHSVRCQQWMANADYELIGIYCRGIEPNDIYEDMQS